MLNVSGQNSLLWKIYKAGFGTSYLFGTFHIIPKDRFEIQKEVLDAFDECEQLVMELDLSSESQKGMVQQANMAEGLSLEDLLSSDDLLKLDSALLAMETSRSLFNNWRPFLISTLFYPSYMPNEVESYELSFLKRANKHRMPILGLETVERQFQVFDEIPYKDQAQDLMEIVGRFDENKKMFDKMVEVYLTGDTELILALSIDELNSSKEVDVLINQRSNEWIPKMENHMQRESTFFAVGAAHLGGEKGVISLLENRGFDVISVN